MGCVMAVGSALPENSDFDAFRMSQQHTRIFSNPYITNDTGVKKDLVQTLVTTSGDASMIDWSGGCMH